MIFLLLSCRVNHPLVSPCPPIRGLPDISNDQILKLKRPVYGRPDAPRAWYNALSGFIMTEMGFERSILDPALFIHRNERNEPDGLLVLHVDDLMIATDGNKLVEQTVDMLVHRFPFGEWGLVKDNASGVVYCGKEILIEDLQGEKVIKMRQRGFIEGRLQDVPLDRERRKQWITM